MRRSTWDVWGLRWLIGLCWWVSGLLCAAPGPGQFDLGRWDQSQPLKLDGDWLYMPGRFVEPHEFEDILDHDHEGVAVLAAGALLQDESTAPRYGTYILRLAGPQKLEDLSLLHGLYYSSAKSQVFCRHQPRRSLTLNLGQVGASISSSTPRVAAYAIQNLQELGSLPVCGELVIMLQISSHHHSRSGIWQTPRLGRTVEFAALRSQQVRSQSFLLLVLLLVSAYGTMLAWGRPGRAAFYLALGTLALSLRMASHFHAMQNTAGSSLWIWHLEKFGIHAAAYLVPYLSWKSLCCVLRGNGPVQRRERGIDGGVLGVLLIQLLTPVRFWTGFQGFFQLLAGGLILLFVYELIRARGRSRRQIGFHIFGPGLVAGGLLLEVLATGRMLDAWTLHIPEYAYAIWLFLQLQLCAQRDADEPQETFDPACNGKDEVLQAEEIPVGNPR